MIIRIICALGILGLEAEGLAFFEGLDRICKERNSAISETSLTFWEKTSKRPFYMITMPDVEGEVEAGKRSERRMD